MIRTKKMPENGTKHQKMPNSHGENRGRTPLEAKIMGENGMEQQMGSRKMYDVRCIEGPLFPSQTRILIDDIRGIVVIENLCRFEFKRYEDENVATVIKERLEKNALSRAWPQPIPMADYSGLLNAVSQTNYSNGYESSLLDALGVGRLF